MKTAIVILLALLVSCAPQSVSQGTYVEHAFSPENDLTEQHFNSVTELKEFIQQQSNNNRGGFGEVMAMDAAMEAAPALAKTAGVDYSETNVQVQGIDEADIIKTDGAYIYTVSGKTLFIISAGEDATIISTLQLNHRPQGLFVRDNKLAIFGSFHDREYFKQIAFRPRHGMTYFDVYDISNKENPERVKEYKFEGNYFQSRMKDEWIYFIVTSVPEVRALPMPVIIEDTVVRNVDIASISYYPMPYDNPQFATIHALTMDGEVQSETIAVESSRNMYMSHENIYITSTKYINEWEIRQDIIIELLESEVTDADRQLIAKIKTTDNEVLSQSEKRNKIVQIYNSYVSYEDDDFHDLVEKRVKEELEQYEALEFTVIHKVEIEQGEIEMEGSTQIPGSIVNQFALDEYDDVLRIATTVNQRWRSPVVFEGDMVDEIMPEPRRTESMNNIYTLDDDLNILDSLTGLAEGERIFSTRFMGDRLYMVTFKQVDPFFVIDLSDPRRIKELGELKIPGFSRYLHPYDDDTIIGIGRDASETGRQQGLKISLFDVSDVTNPQEVAKFVAEGRYSSSAAEYEHKAFLFSKEKNLLVIPAYSYDYRSEEGYNGAMIFHLDTETIDVRGIIDHSSGEQYGAQVERSLYIDDLLYTKSYGLLRVNDLETLESVQKIELKDESGPYVVY